ncbi:hypothetical protein M433DRAFT_460997 [Acidomyces richmondensis BFW]|nr:MAG: hypothetical protein FE78DRAFT_436390 [Acidomyces sp. 'richmondensis']KYG41684.1 hypothetical protein M433DRAFT_460997 [Acidomyces richmondensis BFW]
MVRSKSPKFRIAVTCMTPLVTAWLMRASASSSRYEQRAVSAWFVQVGTAFHPACHNIYSLASRFRQPGPAIFSPAADASVFWVLTLVHPFSRGQSTLPCGCVKHVQLPRSCRTLSNGMTLGRFCGSFEHLGDETWSTKRFHQPRVLWNSFDDF